MKLTSGGRMSLKEISFGNLLKFLREMRKSWSLIWKRCSSGRIGVTIRLISLRFLWSLRAREEMIFKEETMVVILPSIVMVIL